VKAPRRSKVGTPTRGRRKRGETAGGSTSASLRTARTVAVARQIEPIDAAAQEGFWAAMPAEMMRRHPSHTLRLGHALLTVMKKSTSLTMNRVLNLGIEDSVGQDTVDEILGEFRAARVSRLTVHLAPGRQSEAIVGLLRRRGFRPHGHQAKFFREGQPPAPVDTSLMIRLIGPSDAARFGEILCANFGWPQGRAPWVAATVGRPGFTHYMAFAGPQPVATGMLFVQGKGAYLGWGSTLTAFRGRGGQGALIAARIQRARELGCEWMSSDTFEPGAGRSAGSYRNFQRSGFEHVYLRPIYLWEED
jgi:GNAT superfamily N-acetyltransferase